MLVIAMVIEVKDTGDVNSLTRKELKIVITISDKVVVSVPKDFSEQIRFIFGEVKGIFSNILSTKVLGTVVVGSGDVLVDVSVVTDFYGRMV